MRFDDRSQNLPVRLQREKGKEADLNGLSAQLPTVLNIDPDYLQERFGNGKLQSGLTR